MGDADGLSYYATRTLARMLTLSEDGLVEARRQLIQAGVIVYAEPLYQVLALDRTGLTPPATPPATPTSTPTSTPPATTPPTPTATPHSTSTRPPRREELA